MTALIYAHQLQVSAHRLVAVSAKLHQLAAAEAILSRSIDALRSGDPCLPGFVRRALRAGLDREAIVAILQRALCADQSARVA